MSFAADLSEISYSNVSGRESLLEASLIGSKGLKVFVSLLPVLMNSVA